jgi:hypothetical protein
VSGHDRAPSGPGAAALPPAASLLSVPIFRATARRDAAQRAAAVSPADGAAAPATADARTSARSAQPGAPYPVVAGSGEAPAGPAHPPADAARPQPALTAVDGAQSYRTLLDYWRTLARQGRAPVEKLDAGLIAARWPYAMLLRVPRGGVVEIVQVYAPETATGGAAASSPFASDRASQISSWVLAIAQEAAGSRQPSRHSETFQQAGRARRLGAELLPCQADGDSADHLLLQLTDG